MATRFEHNGNIYEVVEGTKEVILRMLSKDYCGKIYIPKYAIYQDRQYTVTSIDGGEWQCYYRINLNENDRRKNESWVNKKGSIEILNIKAHPTNDYLISSTNKDELITSIVIPNSVKTIGPSAFQYFSNLRSVIIPNSVTSIGKRAFFRCIRLEDLFIPDSVTTIGDEAFRDCQALKNITIPKNLETINKSVFCIDNDRNITHIYKNVTHISIPASVIEIKNKAFLGFNSLAEVDIYNDPFEIMIAADAFPPHIKINYIGTHRVLSSIIESVLISKSNKTENSRTITTIDLDKLIDAATADGVVTEKERTTILKKATAAGYDADEIEILLDGKLAEKQTYKTQTPAKKEVVYAPQEEIKLIKKEEAATTKTEKDTKERINLNLAKSTTVAELKQVFNNLFGAKLRIYSGRSQAEENATLGDVGLIKDGTYDCSVKLTIGEFIENMASEFGLKVKVYTCDEWVAVLDGLTLESAGKIKKNAVKADMESLIASQRTK